MMPTENERKYVLVNEPFVLDTIAKQAKKILTIEQAYIQSGKHWNFRVRKTFGIHYDDPIYHATYKHKIDGRVIEIQTKLDERDYRDLSKETISTIVHKTRYVIPAGALKWEVDFFYASKRTQPYFVLAEIELPERVSRPPLIPNFISDHLILAVSEDDGRFSSKKLADSVYAIERYNELIGELNDD